VSDPSNAGRKDGFGELMLGVLLVSTSGPLTILANTEAYKLAFYRMAGGAVCMAVYALLCGHWRWSGVWKQRWSIIGGGALFGLHFVLWIRAFDFTSYTANLALLLAQPIIAAALEVRRGRSFDLRHLLAMVLALAGLIVLSRSALPGKSPWIGNILCVLAGAAMACYYEVTRVPRTRLPLSIFMFGVMSVAAVTSLGAAVLFRPADATAATNVWAIGGIVICATVLGQTLLNSAARRVPLFAVNASILMEPPIATVIGVSVLGQSVSWRDAAGGVLITAGCAMALFRKETSELAAASQGAEA